MQYTIPLVVNQTSFVQHRVTLTFDLAVPVKLAMSFLDKAVHAATEIVMSRYGESSLELYIFDIYQIYIVYMKKAVVGMCSFLSCMFFIRSDRSSALETKSNRCKTSTSDSSPWDHPASLDLHVRNSTHSKTSLEV